MSIRRAPRPASNFYLLDKRISEDRRLTWAARGLLIFLLGKPDHWEVSVTHLITETSDSAKQSRRDAVYGLLKELETTGYLTRSQERIKGGSFGTADYVVHETPFTENPEAVQPETDSPHTEKPDTANPDTAEPDTANPTQVSIEGEVRIEGEPRTDSEQIAPGAAPADAKAEVGEQPVQPRFQIPDDMPGPKDPACKTYRTWANYACAYRKRYGTWPIWNAKVAGQVGTIVARLGADVAPQVAAFYIGVNDARLINDCHSLNNLVAKAESFHTQWQTGRQMNGRTARQLEDTQANINAAQEAASRIRNKEGKRNAFL